jgi:hypothetical protein
LLRVRLGLLVWLVRLMPLLLVRRTRLARLM